VVAGAADGAVEEIGNSGEGDITKGGRSIYRRSKTLNLDERQDRPVAYSTISKEPLRKRRWQLVC
jgi:hypothetical protein